jgi:TolA-binding protein
MSLATAELPADPDALRSFALACQGELKAAETAVQFKTLEIEKLKFQIAKLRRMQFGRSSERISQQIEQLELRLEELETGEAEDAAHAAPSDPSPPARERAQPKRKPLADHLRFFAVWSGWKRPPLASASRPAHLMAFVGSAEGGRFFVPA